MFGQVKENMNVTEKLPELVGWKRRTQLNSSTLEGNVM
jgi:hypothetical protein